MIAPVLSSESAQQEIGYVDRIPVRNLWLLMLYASRLIRYLDKAKRDVEENPDDIPDLVAELLTRIVDRRIRRNLTFGYRRQREVLSRVRGRIDSLTTERRQLLLRGKVACSFDQLTVNTPLNRFVRFALLKIGSMVKDASLRHRCFDLAGRLFASGVVGEKPTRAELSADQLGRNDKGDQLMLSVARLATDLALPTETLGKENLLNPERDSPFIRKLFEAAVGGFYDVALSPKGWSVMTGKYLYWPVDGQSDGMAAILPSMQTDIVLENPGEGRRIIIDTKFTAILGRGQYREESLKSGYIYQIYTYVRSQEEQDDMAKEASGLMLHPSVGAEICEAVRIQGHEIRFATVDLAASTPEIRLQLLNRIGS